MYERSDLKSKMVRLESWLGLRILQARGCGSEF